MSTDAQDLAAHNDWLDNEGDQCATTTGVWFAALQYERDRVAKLTTPAPALAEPAPSPFIIRGLP